MTDPIASTTAGTVRGIARDDVLVFRSIPYAAPPVGPLRFRAPQPVTPWSDVRDATRFGPVAPQLPSPLETMLGAPEPVIDEADSLTLTVFTPGLDDARRPVLFWIHGGAFVNGTGATPIYDGTRFAQHGDLVVVSINYRLGAFGFLQLEEIFGSEFTGSGNAGILDQVCALEWVRDNIAAFGGDPERVTIFGESAGGMSVGTLLGMPAAQGLFSQAVVQSGGGTFCQTAKGATEVARAVLAEAGIDTVAELESASVDAILAAQAKVLASGSRTDLPFMPVVDGSTLPKRPIDSVREGLGAVPTVIGTTKDEMTLFTALDLGIGELDGDAVNRALEASFGNRAREIHAAYAALYPDASPRDLLTVIATDRVFRIPAIRLAEAGIPHRPTFMYLFAWETPVFDGKLKSCHALELPFMWDAIDKPGLSVLTGKGDERQGIADVMHAAWISFARTGDPGWPAYDTHRRATERFDVVADVVEDPMGAQRELWSGV
ncbi:MAG: carboxylesterase/lipase family protein [Acidimicrobiia bacterium]